MVLALVSLALAAPVSACPETWTGRGLLDVVASADLAMGRMDSDGYLAARDLLLTRLGCLAEPLQGPTAGAVHRVVATGAFLERQEARIAPALAGLLAADPGYQIPAALYPDGHLVRRLLPHAALLARETATRPLAPPPSGWLEVDGISAAAAPVSRAAIVQAVDAQGAVIETRYVWPGDDLGAWSAPAAAPVAALPAPPRPARARVPLLVATGASLVATGALYALAADRHDAFLDADTRRSPEDIRALRLETNALTVGWAAAGVATVGLGVGLAFAW